MQAVLSYVHAREGRSASIGAAMSCDLRLLESLVLEFSAQPGRQRGCRSVGSADVLVGPGREFAQRLLGTGGGLRGVDEELLVGIGVRRERIPVECDLTDDRMVIGACAPPLGACAPPLHGDVCSGPPLAELLVSDREVADEFGEAWVVRLACRLHADVGHD
jgi:hypothetical protein